jgi:PAS domain S-box-containing protein
MSPDPTDPLEAARRENRALRARVAELEQLLQRASGSLGSESRPGATLGEREALLSEAERIAHMGSWAWILPTNEVYWSDELYRILAYDPKKDSASSEAFFARIHPEDRARVEEASTRFVETGVGERSDFRILHPDGTIRYASTVGALIRDADGNVGRAVGTVLDITEARDAARELQQTAELLAEAQRIAKMASFEHDVVTGASSWSEEMFRLLDVDPTEKPTRERFVSRVHPEDRARIVAWIEHAINTSEIRPSRARVVHRSGNVRHVDMTVEVVRTASSGTPIAVRGTIADVTDLVQLEAQFHQSQKMEAVGQLAGGLAHDYNNLLTIVLGNAEVLRRERHDDRLDEIVNSARAATSLTQRLLTLSKHENLETRVVDLADEIGQASPLLLRALGESIRLRTSCVPNLPRVRVNGSQIQQILLNLALNARDAMGAGGELRLDASTEVLDANEASQRGVAPGPYAVIRATDTGVGMDESTRARAFDPFFTTKEPGDGTGLGLAMVFSAIRKAGGFVNVHSEPGVGSSFELWFPSATSEAELRAPEREATSPSNASVLLVEDNPSVSKVVKTMLEGAGYRVRVANTPNEALAAWKEHPADVLVTDVVMPALSGVALREKLLETTPDLKTLYITGYSPERLDLQPEWGRTAVVLKPFHDDQLLPALAKLVGEG